jgi:hypothetical protein
MRLKAKWVGAGLVTAIAAAAGTWYLRERSVEKPNYRPIMTDGDFQLRAYPMLVVAETVATGPRADALNRGFEVLADYIFARSRDGEKIAMTAPVLADEQDAGRWRVRFVMPGKWSRASLPTPGKRVEIDEIPARRVAAIRFSGKADDRALEAHEDVLRQWIEDKGLRVAGPPEHAFYDAPIVPGPLRRNEILIPVG